MPKGIKGKVPRQKEGELARQLIASRGRPNGYRVSPATREKIRGAHLIKRLEAFVDGELHEPSQVTAALGLLKFQLPTLQATDITSGGEPLTVERTVFGVKRQE